MGFTSMKHLLAMHMLQRKADLHKPAKGEK
jgi:hypothetical protein